MSILILATISAAVILAARPICAAIHATRDAGYRHVTPRTR